MNITKNFKEKEFYCKDGTKTPAKYMYNIYLLATILQMLRDKYKEKINITSGYRTKEHNKKVKGKSNSYHLQGLAVDFQIENTELKEVYKTLEKWQENGTIPKGGLHLYKNFIHLDVRGKKARW